MRWKRLTFRSKLARHTRGDATTIAGILIFIPLKNGAMNRDQRNIRGQRRYTAFQVDRAKYDTILLDHAQSCGAEVRQGVKVDEVLVNGNRIEGLKLQTGETITAQYYIDGSGTFAMLRRALGIGIDPNLELRNIAVWDYWAGADWAVEFGPRCNAHSDSQSPLRVDLVYSDRLGSNQYRARLSR